MSKHTTNQTSQEIPYGYCHCGCGQKTKIITKNDRGRGHVKGEPLKYIVGHSRSAGKWEAPEFCACGCGQRLKKATGPSHQAIYISGHNNRQPVESRFWERIDKQGPDDCWNWKAGVGSHGYGTMSVNGYPQCTHRIAWSLANGPVPDNLHVLHKCDNRLCCNPAHLFLGTNFENIQDMVRKNRQAKGPNKPDQKGESNKCSILTEKQVLEIRQRCAAGENQDKLAEIYGVSQGHISSIHRRITWKHI